MSALLFRKGKQGLIDGSIDMDAGGIKLAQVQLDGTLTDTHIKAITGVTVATPGVVTSNSHGWSNGDIVMIRGVLGTLNANGLWQIGGVTTNTFTLLTRLDGLNSTTVGAYTSGGCAINLSAATNWSELDGAIVGSLSAALGTLTVTNGVFDAADVSMTLNGTIHAHVLFNDTGTPATSRLVYFMDGRTQIVVAATASISATTLSVERVEGAIPSGTVIQLSNGVVATLTAGAVAGDRTLTVSALSAGVAAGHTGDAQTTNSGYPITLSSGTYTVQFDNGAFRIFEV